MADRPEAILIAGPTASGKSALAIELAREHAGVVINADSMQVYDGLKILTARPDPDSCHGVEHYLFGHVSPERAYSVAEWLSDVNRLIRGLRERNVLPVFAGGTGLYFKALTEGLAQIPEPSPEARARWREFGAADPARLHDELASRDPAGASRLAPGDTQRIVRALEVVDTTGKPISYWQQRPVIQPVFKAPGKQRRLVLEVTPSSLRGRIDSRFDSMVEAGAIEEVRKLWKRDLSPGLPAMKAIGVPQFIQYLKCEIPLDRAIDAAKAATRQYAKRQRTWFRHQMGAEWVRLPASDG